MHIVGASIRVGAGALSRRWIQIDPAFVERTVGCGGILRAERLERRHDVLLGVLGGIGEIH
jgi:hypothetical protein